MENNTKSAPEPRATSSAHKRNKRRHEIFDERRKHVVKLEQEKQAHMVVCRQKVDARVDENVAEKLRKIVWQAKMDNTRRQNDTSKQRKEKEKVRLRRLATPQGGKGARSATDIDLAKKYEEIPEMLEQVRVDIFHNDLLRSHDERMMHYARSKQMVRRNDSHCDKIMSKVIGDTGSPRSVGSPLRSRSPEKIRIPEFDKLRATSAPCNLDQGLSRLHTDRIRKSRQHWFGLQTTLQSEKVRRNDELLHDLDCRATRHWQDNLDKGVAASKDNATRRNQQLEKLQERKAEKNDALQQRQHNSAVKEQEMEERLDKMRENREEKIHHKTRRYKRRLDNANLCCQKTLALLRRNFIESERERAARWTCGNLEQHKAIAQKAENFSAKVSACQQWKRNAEEEFRSSTVTFLNEKMTRPTKSREPTNLWIKRPKSSMQKEISPLPDDWREGDDDLELGAKLLESEGKAKKDDSETIQDEVGAVLQRKKSKKPPVFRYKTDINTGMALDFLRLRSQGNTPNDSVLWTFIHPNRSDYTTSEGEPLRGLPYESTPPRPKFLDMKPLDTLAPDPSHAKYASRAFRNNHLPSSIYTRECY